MEIKSNGEVLDSFFNTLKNNDKDFSGKQNTVKSWVDYVGEVMGKNSTVHDIDGERLIVEVYNSATLQTLRLKEMEILNSVNKKYPALKLKKIILKYVDKTSELKCDFNDFKPEKKEYIETKTNDIELDELLKEIDIYSKQTK